MERMVLGFAFTANKKEVLLILKNHPDWQKNKLNGIGGKVNAHESALDAMRREAEEEAGLGHLPWTHVGRLLGNDFEVRVFATASDDVHNFKQKEKEVLFLQRLDDLLQVQALAPAVLVNNVMAMICLLRYDHTFRLFEIKYY